jgi:hypothetical protein
MKLVAGIALGVWMAVAGYFFWEGVTTKPMENDSLGWHVPIAESILKGRVWGRDLYVSVYGYYPGMGEMILAFLMVWGIPLNLYNWIGWVALGVVTRALGKRRGLGDDLATILAVAVVFFPTAMRLFPTQLIDVWLAVWWGWLLWLLEKPNKSLRYWVALGAAAGMVVGTKYTGLVLVALAGVVYFRSLRKNWSLKGALGAAMMTMLLGGFWYVRNWVVWGDPLYPQNFLWFRGYDAFQLPIIWKDLLLSGKGWVLLVQALFSEYLVWGILLLLPVVYRSAWVWMGVVIVGMYLILPGDARTVISNFRYLIPGFMVLVLSAGEFIKRLKKEEWLGMVAVVNIVSVLPQLNYHPKVWLTGVALWAGWMWRQKYGKSGK